MFSKSNVLGTLSGFIILFFLGFLYYDILANDFMMEASNQAISKIPADMFYLSLGYSFKLLACLPFTKN